VFSCPGALDIRHNKSYIMVNECKRIFREVYMKQYINKRSILLVVFILCVGALFTGCSIRYIVNSSTNLLKKEDATRFQVEKGVVAPITKIDIHTRVAEVEILSAEEYHVEIDYLYWEEEPVYSLEDGILYFNDSKSFPNSYSINFNLQNKIKIYLPDNNLITELNIENSSGDVNLSGILAEELDVTVSYGDFTLKQAAAKQADINLSSGSSVISDFQAGDLTFTNSYGNAKFTNINTGDRILPEDVIFDQVKVTMSSGDVTINNIQSSSIDINNSYGNVTIDEITAKEQDYNLSSGNLKIKKADVEETDINNSYGNVTLIYIGQVSDYHIDLTTSYGKIKVEDKIYEDQVTLDVNGSRKISADLSSGDITVNFENK
jgi:hypothetical protein